MFSIIIIPSFNQYFKMSYFYSILSFRNLVCYSTLQFRLATFLLLDGYRWLVAMYWTVGL